MPERDRCALRGFGSRNRGGRKSRLLVKTTESTTDLPPQG
jgi:hypothetical protein